MIGGGRWRRLGGRWKRWSNNSCRRRRKKIEGGGRWRKEVVEWEEEDS